MRKEEQTDNSAQASARGSGTVLVYAVAALYVVLGLAFLLIPQLQVLHLCYLFAICLILLGVIKIAEYFIRESYKNSVQYGFSLGVIAMILGICVLVRAQQFAGIFHVFLGIGILLTAVVKLQHALDLRAIKDGGYLWLLGAAVLMVLAASLVLLNPFSDPEVQNLVTYIVMVFDGVLTLISTTYLLVRMRQRRKRDQDRLEEAADRLEAAEYRTEDVGKS